MMEKEKHDVADVTADQVCMMECVLAFKKLARHYSKEHDSDSVAVAEGQKSIIRVANWLTAYLNDHRYL